MEDLLDLRGGRECAHADAPAVVRRDLQHQPAHRHPEHIIAAQLSGQTLLDDIFDDPRPMHGVDDAVADQKHTRTSSSGYKPAHVYYMGSFSDFQEKYPANFVANGTLRGASLPSPCHTGRLC